MLVPSRNSFFFLKGATLNSCFLFLFLFSKQYTTDEVERDISNLLEFGEKKTQNIFYWCPTSLERLQLALKLHVSCMLPEQRLEEEPDVTHGTYLCPSQC